MIIGGTFEELLSFIKNNEELSFDVETTGLHKRRDKIIGFGVSGRAANTSSYIGYYIALYEWDPGTSKLRSTNADSQAEKVLELLKTKKLRTWNGAFDLSITKNNFGVDLVDQLYCDGMLLSHLVNENEYDYRLKDTAKRLFGPSAVEAEEDLKQEVIARGGKWTKENKQMFMASAAILGKYCIADCVLTNRIIDAKLPELKKQGLEEFFFEQETMPLYRLFTIPAENHGIRLDMPLLLGAQNDIGTDIAQIESEILADIEPHLGIFRKWFLNKDYPPSREGAFAQGYCALYASHLPRTKTGKFKLTADVVQELPDGRVKSVLTKQARLTDEEIQAVQVSLWAVDGSPGFNLQSKHHLKKLFFDTLKEQPLSTTPTGQPQVDDDFIEIMAKKYKWASKLRTYNRLNKLKSTYMDRFVDANENGYFYPSYQQHRTVSGRLAGDLQQLPRPIDRPSPDDIVAKYQNLIRAFFIAEKGHILVDDDYESAEPRVFAHVSNELALKNIFKLGHDFYSTIAIKTEGLKGISADKQAPNYLGTVNKAKRQSSKSYALGIPYGLTGYKLQYELNIPLDEAEELVSGYLSGFPSLNKEMQAARNEALKTGQVRTEAGRIRHLDRAVEIYAKYGEVILDDLELWKKFNDMPGLYAQAKQHRRELKNLLNNSFNAKVQGLVANIINRASIAIVKRFRKECPQAILFAQIHDELIVQVPIDQAEKAGKIVQECMETAWPISVPMVAVPSYGQNFRDAKNG